MFPAFWLAWVAMRDRLYQKQAWQQRASQRLRATLPGRALQAPGAHEWPNRHHDRRMCTRHTDRPTDPKLSDTSHTARRYAGDHPADRAAGWQREQAFVRGLSPESRYLIDVTLPEISLRCWIVASNSSRDLRAPHRRGPEARSASPGRAALAQGDG
jgi:hypothetical protein